MSFYSFAYIKMVKYMEEFNEKIFLKKIGEKLKFYRKKAGYSNYEYFAYDNNISRPQYGKYEAGANIQLNTLYKILKALKVTPEEFFKGIE
jgi:transcriptional regulator with XRE-family HTH domain